MDFIGIFLHLDSTLGSAIAAYGGWIYLILFVIVFCETGLVVTPFLPGDSLLFAAGAFAAAGALDPFVVFGLMFAAAVLGDAVNYRIGRKIGARVQQTGKLAGLPFKKEYLDKTRAYYVRYGAKTIVLARFMPFLRTFAPFVAGVGEMPAATFFAYNLLGGALWTGLFVLGGYLFGNIPIVKNNFEIVILGIVFISIMPAVIAYFRERKRG